MSLSPDKAVSVTLATIALHNMLRERGPQLYTDVNDLDVENEDGLITEGKWRQPNTDHLKNIPKGKQNHARKSAESVRDTLADHFYGEGAIPWQWNVLL